MRCRSPKNFCGNFNRNRQKLEEGVRQNGDGAFDLPPGVNTHPKRCRASLATALHKGAHLECAGRAVSDDGAFDPPPGLNINPKRCRASLATALHKCGAADSSVELESDLNVEEREGFSGSERDWIASCSGRLFRNRCGK